jgi:hypothetical protein
VDVSVVGLLVREVMFVVRGAPSGVGVWGLNLTTTIEGAQADNDATIGCTE